MAYPSEIVDQNLTISTLRLAIIETINVDIKPEHVRIVEHVSLTISHQLTDESLLLGCENTKIQLTARCAGLLEVPEFDQRGLRATIEYLHRTARDFIENEKNWQEILQHTLGTAFRPDISILRASLL